MKKARQMTTRLPDYLKSLSKALKSAQDDFWKDMKAAEKTFHNDIVAAMRDYEKVEYSSKRVPGAIASASKVFNDQYNTAYQILGRTTRAALERFERKIEELIGV